MHSCPFSPSVPPTEGWFVLDTLCPFNASPWAHRPHSREPVKTAAVRQIHFEYFGGERTTEGEWGRKIQRGSERASPVWYLWKKCNKIISMVVMGNFLNLSNCSVCISWLPNVVSVGVKKVMLTGWKYKGQEEGLANWFKSSDTGRYARKLTPVSKSEQSLHTSKNDVGHLWNCCKIIL